VEHRYHDAAAGLGAFAEVTQADDFIVMSACSTCAGFIATLESRIGSGTEAAAS